MNEQRLRGVIGIIEKDGKYLFGLESKDTPIKGKWRLLGGKLEPGENSVQALHRELEEEAGIGIMVGRYLGNTNGTLRDIIIDVYACKRYRGRLKPKLDENSIIGWFSPEQIKAMDVESLSRQMFEKYLELRERENRKPEPCYSTYMGCDAGAIG